MFSLSFVGGSISVSGFGRGGGGPNPLGHRQHSIERDVDLHVEIECLKKCDTYTIEASK